MNTKNEFGILLANGCRVTHGTGANVKRPFSDVDLTMHELSTEDVQQTRYVGQLGFIPFTAEYRLPRHVHIAKDKASGEQKFVAERILVLNGVALTELGGEVFLVPPGSLVDIIPGIPHTWTACPAGVRLPDGTVSDGTFLMVYNYEEDTGFFPTSQVATMTHVSEYERFDGELANIMFPKLSAEDVTRDATFVWDRATRSDLALA